MNRKIGEGKAKGNDIQRTETIFVVKNTNRSSTAF